MQVKNRKDKKFIRIFTYCTQEKPYQFLLTPQKNPIFTPKTPYVLTKSYPDFFCTDSEFRDPKRTFGGFF